MAGRSLGGQRPRRIRLPRLGTDGPRRHAAAALCTASGLLLIGLAARPIPFHAQLTGTWTAQTSGTVSALNAVDFVDSLHGWAVGAAGTIVATADGGATWTAQTSGTPNGLNGVSFVDTQHGWAVGTGGTLLATADGGTTWSALASGTTDGLNAVHFRDASTGWFVGNNGDIDETTDGGATWVSEAVNSNNLLGLSFDAASDGWAVGGGGAVVHTSNGSAWSAAPGGPGSLQAVDFISSSIGWAVGGDQNVHKTVNGAASWTNIDSHAGQPLNAVSFSDASNGWVAGNSGTLMSTADGGSTWTAVVTGVTDNFLALSFPSPTQGWAVGTNGTIFHYSGGPVIASVSPAYGTTAGGTTVTLGGSGFTGATAVAFGGTAAGSFTVNSDASITVTSPAAAAGTVDITVTTPLGTSLASSADQFLYEGAPTVTSISPNSGNSAGGTSVTVTGSGFLGTTSVSFGGAPASFTVISATQLTATSPAGAGAVDITVSSVGGGSAMGPPDVFTYNSLPVVSGVSPAQGPQGGGTSITISGSHLTGATAVDVGGTAATAVTVVDDSTVTATVPAGSGAADVVVTTGAGSSATSPADLFTYDPVPAVTSVSPMVGPVAGGNSVIITGSGFTAATAVNFQTAAATSFSVDSDTQITAVAPAQSAGTYDVIVTTPGGTSPQTGADNYTYKKLPAITSVSPSAGALGGGNTVTITGTNLSPTKGVSFGAVAAVSYTQVSGTTVTAVVPAQAAGTVDVFVTSDVGTSVAVAADHYIYAPVPVVSAVAPAQGPLSGGGTVTISGSGFTTATTVQFGGTAGTGVVVNNDSSITVTVPAGSAGAVDVTVTSPGGTSATGAADTYTYVAAPSVGGVNPARGPLGGGGTVTITGSGMGNVSAVDFGGVAATTFTIVNATTLTAVVPAQAAGSVDVTVTNPGGVSPAGAADVYTYVPVPTVTSVSPGFGPSSGGTTVQINGGGFTAASTVRFGGAAASFSVISDTQISATAPAASPGILDITVTTPGGTSPTGSADRFVYDGSPWIAGLSANSGPSGGGTGVTVTGSGFLVISSVSVGGVPVSFTVASDGSLSFTTPPGVPGAASVVLAGPAGSTAATFTFVAPPVPPASAPPGPGPTPTPAPAPNPTPPTDSGKGGDGDPVVTITKTLPPDAGSDPTATPAPAPPRSGGNPGGGGDQGGATTVVAPSGGLLGLFSPNSDWSLIPGPAFSRHPVSFTTAIVLLCSGLFIALGPRRRRKDLSIGERLPTVV